MKRLHPLAWFLIGLAVAGMNASLAQVYNFFPAPGMTYSPATTMGTTNKLGVTASITAGGYTFNANNGSASVGGGSIAFNAGNSSGLNGGSVVATTGSGSDLSQAGSFVANIGPTGTPSASLFAAHSELSFTTHDSVTLNGQVLPIFAVKSTVGGTTTASFISFQNDTGTNNSSFQFGGTSSTGTCTATLGYTGVPAAPCFYIDSGTTSYPVVLATNFTSGGYIGGTDQGLVWGSATGGTTGDMGHGTINTASGFYVNGVPLTLTGATFTITSGCATTSSLTGTSTTGSFATTTTGTCTPVLALPTAPHGWHCNADDITHPVHFTQTAVAPGSCTVSGATTSGDTVVFDAIPY